MFERGLCLRKDLCLRGVCIWPLFCIAVIGVLSSFAIISLKRELIALLSACAYPEGGGVGVGGGTES